MKSAQRLAWLAALAMVSLPVVAFLGRERPFGCDSPRLSSPCDPALRRPEWAFWAFGIVVLLNVILVSAAGIMTWRSRRQAN
jgi:hypothetical protein